MGSSLHHIATVTAFSTERPSRNGSKSQAGVRENAKLCHYISALHMMQHHWVGKCLVTAFGGAPRSGAGFPAIQLINWL